MNENEYRRKELLQQTRNLYKESREIPAVHPRHQNIYKDLYGTNTISKKSNFSARLGAALVLFVLFATADYNQLKIGDYSSELVVHIIESDVHMESVATWFTK